MKDFMPGLRPTSRLLFVFLFAAFAATLHAQAKLSIQGFLKKSDGTALADGEYSLRFRIYNVETGGTALWTETQAAVDVIGGIYSAVLGSVEPLNISFNESYFVSVAVGSGSEMVPRIPLTSAPYALSLIGQDNKFPSSGNVGVGVASPTEKLHVKNTATTSSTAKILLEGPATGLTELNIKKAGLTGIGYLGYAASGSSALRLGHTNGNLDLITSSAGSSIYLSTPTTGQVQVASSLLVERNVVARGGAPGAAGINQNGYAFAGSGGDNDSGLYSLGDGQVSLFANSTEVVNVSSGSVLVRGGVFARGGAPGGSNVNKNGFAFFDNSGDNDSGLFSLNDGDVALYSNGNEALALTPSNTYLKIVPIGTGNALGIQSDGRIVKASSSRRYKQNIQPLIVDFKRVLDIEPKSYNYKTTPDKLDIGFIAEELDSLGLKHLVVYDDKGRPDGVLYDRTCIYLIPLLREQQQRIAALEAAQAENTALRQSLQSLRADVEALKAGGAQGREGERK